jgi:hypothetical protein
MRYETWQMGYNILILVGIIITGIGGYGSFLYGKKIEESGSIEADKNEKILNKKIDSLLDDNEKIMFKLEPFEKLAQKMFPNEKSEIALSKLQKEIEIIKIRTLDLEVKNQPRSINDSQRKSLFTSMHNLYSLGYHKIRIISVLGDQESLNYANQFKDLFRSVKWEVVGEQGIFVKAPIGLIIYSPNDPAPNYIDDFYNYFIGSGFVISGELDSSLKNGEFKIVVGAK